MTIWYSGVEMPVLASNQVDGSKVDLKMGPPNPAGAVCRAFVNRKSGELVAPVTYAFPAASTATAFASSSRTPPKYLPYTNALPAGLSLTINPSVRPAKTVPEIGPGKLLELVTP